MRASLKTTTITMLALVFPIAAVASINGSPTLSTNQTLNLDNGKVGSSGGDILWNGSTGNITLQGSATAANYSLFGGMGASSFSAVTQSLLSVIPAQQYSSAPIAASALVGNIYSVHTNGGNYAAFLIVSVTGTSLNLQFISFASTAPTITQVLNNYGLIPAGFPNSGIAQGSLFIIKGSLLADPNAQALPLQSSTSGSGLPKTLNGASVQVTVMGTTTVPVFYYAIASQLALVLPSNTPAGSGTITVTYNGQTSVPFPIQVVSSAMGFDAYYGTGSGLGVATSNATGALFNYSNAIPPGTIVVMWGSGLGADAARDSQYVAPPSNINGLAHVYVGGVDAQIVYQGASGFPGLNQVDITIPANAPTGCNVSVVGVSAAGVPTNSITLPIGNGVCEDPAFATSGNTLTSLSGQTTVNTGFVFLGQTSSTPQGGGGAQISNVAAASFQSYTGSAYGSATGTVSIGGCIIQQSLTSSSVGTTTALNAGTITVTGPAGNAVLQGNSLLPGLYAAMLPSGFITASGGAFSFQGTAGTTAPAVGAFNAQVVFPSPLLSWTNQLVDTTVTRNVPLSVTWTGGVPGTYVTISGSSSSGLVTAGFTCIAPVSAQIFTVPIYVLNVLPVSNSGSLTVSNQTAPQTFQATGIDYGYAVGVISYKINTVYQ